MGMELMKTFPRYLKTIRDLDDVLKSLEESPEWTIEGRFPRLLLSQRLVR